MNILCEISGSHCDKYENDCLFDMYILHLVIYIISVCFVALVIV
jgi:hypothetical protein